MGGFCVLGFLLIAAAAAEFGAGDEREEDKAAMGFLMMPTYITREVCKVQRRVLKPPFLALLGFHLFFMPSAFRMRNF